jgi:multidrug efflux pump subunit AcrB
MGIVRFALRFPHTFYVVAALILFLGVAAIRSMPTDIFPEINIPVVSVIWQYTGLTTPEMEQRVTTYSQYSISTSVSGIKNMEAQTIDGVSVQKLYFQPDVNVDLAIAQIVAATNSIRALLPPGIQPPIVVQYNASSVPVLQLSLNSDNLNEQQLYDYGIYRIRQQLAPVPGVTLPTPAGGKYRQIMVDIDPDKLLARGLTPLDIVNAVNAQNLTLPSGTAKMGDVQYTVRTNATPSTIDDLNNMPVKFANGATHLREGRGAGPRRVAGAAEHRARGWPPLGLAQRDQERQCLHAGGRQRRQEGNRDRPRLRAGRTQDQRAVRPIGIRYRLGQGRAA